jgi:hypothetical protein
VSWCRKPMRNHFLHPGHRKKLLGRSCLSDVGEWPWYLIIWLLDALRNDFSEIVSTTFQSFEKLYEVIFSIVRMEKCDLDEFA